MLWHYTHDGKVEAIKQSGMLKAFNDYDHADTWGIKLSPAAMRKMAKEKRAVWFSANQNYEPSAAKTNGRKVSDHFGMMQDLGTVLRFGIRKETAGLLPHRKAFKAIGLTSKQVEMMDGVTRKQEGSNPDEHFALLRDVPLKEVVAIQKYDPMTKQWVDIEL